MFSVVDPAVRILSVNATFWETYGATIQNAITPLALALCNSVVIPLFVDIVGAYQQKESKTDEHKRILQLNLIFMTINMIFLPLTGLISSQELVDLWLEESEVSILKTMSQNIGQMAAFFATYIMQTTFIFNCVQLLDLPHLCIMGIQWASASVKGDLYKDQYPFQLGYYQAFTATVGLMSLIFSTVMPFCSFFAFFFFFFRYYIEKYNFLFVYQSQFESRGNLRKSLLVYMVFGVILFQVMNLLFIQSFKLIPFYALVAYYCFITMQGVLGIVLYNTDDNHLDFFKPSEDEGVEEQK